MEKYYVSGCRDDGEATVTCEDSEATFWTLYARDEKGLSQGIIDLAFREDAEAALAVYVERDALQEQAQKLAAEVIYLRSAHPQPFGREMMKAIDAYIAKEDETPESGMLDAFFILRDSIVIKQEQTDAVIREIGAKAVEDVADSPNFSLWVKQMLKGHVARIRAGEQL